MKKIGIIYLFVFAAVNLSFIIHNNRGEATNSIAYSIDWSADNPLTWDNFIGKPERGSVSAITASGIEYSYECSGNSIKVKARAIFIPKESWVQHNSKTDYILAHEQLHFDLTELYSRKLRARISTEVTNCQHVSKLVKIAKQITEEWNVEQDRYDAETRHSMNKESQLVWSKKVKSELERYKAFAL